MGVAARGRGTVLTDVAADELATALSARGGDRLRPRSARSAPDAVDVVASLGPGVVVVAPTAPAAHADADDVHRAVAERTRWWCEAAAVTGAFVVLVGTSDVFGPEAPTTDGVAPDEFSQPAPDDVTGRAWRAAEGVVRAVDGAVVRRDPGSDPDAVAGLVWWAVTGRRRGVWHVGGGRLDDRHTRIVRSGSDPGGRRAVGHP
jgi:hypothetical protein